MKDSKGHGSDARGFGLTPSERGKAGYAQTVINTIRNAFTGNTGAHTTGIHDSTIGSRLDSNPDPRTFFKDAASGRWLPYGAGAMARGNRPAAPKESGPVGPRGFGPGFGVNPSRK